MPDRRKGCIPILTVTPSGRGSPRTPLTSLVYKQLSSFRQRPAGNRIPESELGSKTCSTGIRQWCRTTSSSPRTRPPAARWPTSSNSGRNGAWRAYICRLPRSNWSALRRNIAETGSPNGCSPRCSSGTQPACPGQHQRHGFSGGMAVRPATVADADVLADFDRRLTDCNTLSCPRDAAVWRYEIAGRRPADIARLPGAHRARHAAGAVAGGLS